MVLALQCNVPDIYKMLMGRPITVIFVLMREGRQINERFIYYRGEIIQTL